MTRTLTRTGRMVDLQKPDPATVNFDDIATSLAKQCRFNGHCSSFYSVAQHSVLVSDHATREAKAYALLHDAHEAYIGDITRPVRELGPQLYLFDVTRNLDAAIHHAAGLAWPPEAHISHEIAELDDILLMTERRDLMARSPVSWGALESVTPLPTRIKPLAWDWAEELFRNRLTSLFPNL